MKFSRSRKTILVNALTCALALAGSAAAQQSPVVAQNIGDTRDVSQPTAQPSAVGTKPIAPAYDPASLVRVGVQPAAPLPLSLRDAIVRALQSNNDIEVSRGDVRFQATQVRALEGLYDPVFNLTPSFPRSSTTGSAATSDRNFNSNVTGAIKPGGGNYQFFFNNTRTENAFSQAQVSAGSLSSAGNTAIYSSSLGFAYNQPLARNRSIDLTRRQIIIARRRLEQTDSDFRLRATETIANVQRSYWDLVFALRNQQNQVANVNLAKENLRQVEAKIEAGASAPLERAEVATELANREGELLAATQQVSVAENELKRLVLRDPLSPEWLEPFVPTDTPVVSPDPASLEAALKDAMDNRFELRRLRLEKEISATDVKYFKNQTKPQIDLDTRFSLNGLARAGQNTELLTSLLTSSNDIFLFNTLNDTRVALGLAPVGNPPLIIPPLPSFLLGGFGQSMANMFRSDAPNFSIGMTISFPFRNRTAKANLEGARIQAEQVDARTRGQEQLIFTEVRNAVQAVETSRQRVLTARRARENAEIQLEGERKLYEVGRSTTFLLFQRENSLTNARNAEIRAETDHNKALADLQRVTSTAFQLNNIIVDEPVPNLR